MSPLFPLPSKTYNPERGKEEEEEEEEEEEGGEGDSGVLWVFPQVMGLSNFPAPSQGLLPLLLLNAVLSVALLKNMVTSLLQYWIHVAAAHLISFHGSQQDHGLGSIRTSSSSSSSRRRRRRISTTKFRALSSSSSSAAAGDQASGVASPTVVECCVCLCRFQEGEEVSELSCKHFFHKGCLQKWFDNGRHTTCPLCRSIK